MAGKGGEMKEVMKEVPGISVERVELGEFLADKSGLVHLKYNVLTDSEDESLSHTVTTTERHHELKPIRADLRSSPQHEVAYVAKDGPTVIGLLAIGLDEGEAVIEQFWSVKPEGTQHDIVAALVGKAQSDLPHRSERQYPHLYINAGHGGKVSKPLKHLANNPAIASFLRFREAANDTSAPLEQPM